MKTNKPNTRNHTRKHRTTCNKVKFGNDTNNAECGAEGRVRSVTALLYCQIYSPKRGNTNNNYFASVFFSNDPCGKYCVGTVIYKRSVQ